MQTDTLDRAVRLWSACARGKVNGLTWADFCALHLSHPEPAAVSWLVERLGGQVTRVLRRLRRLGLVEPYVDDVDARRRFAQLTAEGLRVYELAARQHARALGEKE